MIKGGVKIFLLSPLFFMALASVLLYADEGTGPAAGNVSPYYRVLDGKMAMAVLPAPEHVDPGLLQGAAGARSVELANEHEFKNLFPQCDVGAMPPFGNIYGMEVYVEEGLREDKMIAFKAGSHEELIELAYQDYERLVKPRVVRLSTRYAAATA